MGAERMGTHVAGGPPPVVAGRYRLGWALGSGTSREVYAARDERTGRQVAVALIKVAGDSQARVRWEREVQAHRRLGAHPHLVEALASGEEDGRPYLVSELMEGGDLADRLARSGRPDVPAALRLALEICAGLKHAHARGVVHRDVKPDNVWLTASGTAKLGDFGLALLLDAPAPTGRIAGSVGYMPPEQALGRPVDARADLYALGATLYELLTGAPPFGRERDPGPPRRGLLGRLAHLRRMVCVTMQHLEGTAPPPSRANPAVPPALDALVARLLAKLPEDRPANAGEVRQALQAVTNTVG